MNANSDIVAGKIVPKSLLVKQHQREKMAQEISLHKQLNHKFVVKLFSYFEDSNFVYIVLELCRRRSMMELHKRRKAITEPETRYFMNQILLGVKYLHEQKIIHRDLKLGNIFLNDDMEVCTYLCIYNKQFLTASFGSRSLKFVCCYHTCCSAILLIGP